MRINENFYNDKGIIEHITKTISKLQCYNKLNLDEDINKAKFRLFDYIGENFQTNLDHLKNKDFDYDYLGFPVIHRNIRHSIEAYSDFKILCEDKSYYFFLKYQWLRRTAKRDGKEKEYEEVRERYDPQKYKNILLFKEKLRKFYNEEEFFKQRLYNIYCRSNKYVHPNIFIEDIAPNEYNKKIRILKELLKLDAELLTRTYELILEEFNSGGYPILECNKCNHCVNYEGWLEYKCKECYEERKEKHFTLIDNALIKEL